MPTKIIVREWQKMELTENQIKFANLVYEDKLTDVQIAKECRISARQVYRWKKNPDIIRMVNGLAEADVKQAKRILQRNSRRAARILVLLTQVSNDSRLIYEEEVARRAANDILRGSGCLDIMELDEETKDSSQGEKKGFGELLRHLDTDRLATIVETVQRRIRVTH